MAAASDHLENVENIPRTKAHQSVDVQMTRFGESLNPSKGFYEEGKRLAQNVFLELQKSLPRNFSLAEPRFAGSFAKGTAVLEPDLDLYIVVNKRTPPFDVVLDEVEIILKRYYKELNIQEASIKQGGSQGKPRVSMQFIFHTGTEVDLLPAANMTRDAVLAEIAKDPAKNFYIYNTSLVPVQLEFMRSFDTFTHSLIRLLKFWIKSLNFGKRKFFGGSTIMELVGCASSEEEKSKHEKPSMLRAFARALQIISGLDSLKLAFEPITAPSRNKTGWKRVPLSELDPDDSPVIPKVVGTADILKRKCFMVEPANPYYDHLDGKDPDMIQQLKDFAKETTQRLAPLMKLVFEGTQVYVDFAKLFEPQPTPDQLRTICPVLLPGDFCLGYDFPSDATSIVSTTLRKDDILSTKGIILLIDNLKWYMLSLIHSMTHNPDPASVITVKNVREAVDNLVTSVFGISSIPPSAGGDRHDQMEVTVYIPYKLKEGDFAVKLSMNWSSASCCVV